MKYDKYSDFLYDAKDKAMDFAQDVKDGLSVLDRFTVKKSIHTKTQLTDKKYGKTLVNTEDEYSREFSLLKAIIIGVMLFVSAIIIISNLKSGAKNAKECRRQKKELRKIKKFCKKAEVELPEEYKF